MPADNRSIQLRIGGCLSGLLIGVVASLIAAIIYDTWRDKARSSVALPREQSEMDSPRPGRPERSTEPPVPPTDHSRIWRQNDPESGVVEENVAESATAQLELESLASSPSARAQPKDGLAFVTRTDSGDPDFSIDHALRAAFVNGKLSDLSADEVDRLTRDPEIWARELPTQVLIIRSSARVESAALGRFRAEAVLAATFREFPDSIRRFRTSAFGAGFSADEAIDVAKKKAVENLKDQILLVRVD